MPQGNFRLRSTNNPAEIWQEFVKDEVKKGSKVGKSVEGSEFGSLNSDTSNIQTLKLYFQDDQKRKRAQGLREKIQNNLSDRFGLWCNRIEFLAGSAPTIQTREYNSTLSEASVTDNPLQAFYWVEPELPVENENKQRLAILRAAIAAERNCEHIYQHLTARTTSLVGSPENILTVAFNWRLRVGGTRGFRDLLLPVLHPVFGIPYIPASTLKGATRAWARRNISEAETDRLLGTLKNGLSHVEFMDAFPTSACLSLDVATPQWHWDIDQSSRTSQEELYVKYQPEPHPLVSLEKPEFLVGIRPTSIGNQSDVNEIKLWLKEALSCGIGSRVSSGYGYPHISEQDAEQRTQDNQVQLPFVLWTQGSYGINPPAKENGYNGTPEFRPTALRGVLRYWFRAVALALYPPSICKSHEEELFGTLGKQGLVSIQTSAVEVRSDQPYLYEGTVRLIAADQDILQLAEKILVLASCLGGLGRGSRRPLHQVNGYWRGCYWELQRSPLPLPEQKQDWESLVNETRQIISLWKTSTQKYSSFPGKPGARRQDVLDDKAQVWLMPSSISRGKHPNKVNWSKEGSYPQVRGSALNLLYGNSDFKGKSGNQAGNPSVGGSMPGGTPSYVWIKSVFPAQVDPYQVVTIFGANDSNRLAFSKAVQQAGGTLVWGKKKKVIG